MTQAMSLELLQSIEKAELGAEAIRADAQKEAREILKAVEEACTQNERTAAIDQRAMAQRVLEDARLAATKHIEVAAAKDKDARDAVVAAARQKLDAAANLIFERVVENGHR